MALLKMDGRHLAHVVTLKIITEHVVTPEYKTVKELYPLMVKEVTERTRLKPVTTFCFRRYLQELVKEGGILGLREYKKVMPAGPLQIVWSFRKIPVVQNASDLATGMAES